MLSRATEPVPLEGSFVGLASLPSLFALLPEYRALWRAGREVIPQESVPSSRNCPNVVLLVP